jgi:hypothetical protein
MESGPYQTAAGASGPHANVAEPVKTCIVYCKDDNRRATYANDRFDFLRYRFVLAAPRVRLANSLSASRRRQATRLSKREESSCEGGGSICAVARPLVTWHS